MTREMSIYLDLVRFSAAFLVLVYHSYGRGMTGGFLWQIGSYGQTAVMIFFVLSGYVISYVASTKERTLRDYAFARTARIYSVVIPALIVTLVCNELGTSLMSDQYRGPWNKDEPHTYLRYLASLLMVQDLWSAGLSPTNNGPFWSITFEVVYYILFAAAFYLKGRRRIALFAGAAAAAGPTVLALFPLWLAGVYVHRLHRRNVPDALSGGVATLIFAASAAVLAMSPTYRAVLDLKLPWVDRDSVIGDYLDAIAFSAHVLAAPAVVRHFSTLFKYIGPGIVALAGLTFSLYLFHQPLVRLFAGVSPFIGEPASTANRLFVYSMMFLVVAVVGVPAERSKSALNKWLRRWGTGHR